MITPFRRVAPGPEDVPAAAPELSLVLRPECRRLFTPAELFLYVAQVRLDVRGEDLLSLCEQCGWTRNQYCAVLAALAAKLTP